MTETQDAIGVAVLGLGDRAKNVLRLFFDNHCRGLCSLVDHAQAQVTLIDLDAYGGMDLKIKHDNLYPGRPTILMSVNEMKPEGHSLFVRKPLVAKQLLAALNEAKVRLDAQKTDEALHGEQTKGRHLGEDRQQPRQRPAEDRAARRGVSGAGASAEQPSAAATVASPSRPASARPIPKPGTGSEPGSQPKPAAVVGAEAVARTPVRAASEPAPFGRQLPPTPTPVPPEPAEPPPTAKTSSTGGVAAAAGQIDDDSSVLFVGSAPDIDPNDPEAVAGAKYCGKLYLQGYLIKACHDAEAGRTPMTLTGLWRTIVIDPVTRTISYEVSLSQLRSLCIVPVKVGEVFIETLSSRGDRPDVIDPGRWHKEPLDGFLWRIALWTSRGRVPEHCDLRAQVFIKHWPDMTRLQASPHALRIAALWVKRPYGLLQTAKLLGIPQRFVFAFYSAAWAIDLAGQGRRQSDQLVETDPPPPSPRKGLLGRILSRLRGRHQ